MSESDNYNFTNPNLIIKNLYILRSKNIFYVWLSNVFQLVNHWKNILFFILLKLIKILVFFKLNIFESKIKKYSHRLSEYYFYNLIYQLLAYNLISKKDYKYLNNPKITIENINKYLAKIIFKAIRKDNSRFKQHQKVSLKKLYSHWIKSLVSKSKKTYLQSHYNKTEPKPSADERIYEYSQKGKVIRAKPKNYFKLFLIFQGYIAIVCTAIAEGLLPAVLATTTSSALLLNILWIGIPSTIINLVLYNKSVMDLIKDLWYGRLLHGTSRARNILTFIISACGGITYSILMFSTAVAAFSLFMPASLAIILAVISAGYACLALTALYFSAINELSFNITLVLNKLKKFFIGNFFAKKYFYIFSQACIFIAIISGACLLALLEASMFYASAISLLAAPWLVVILIALAAPANFMFTAIVFSNLYNFVRNLPQIIYNFFKYIKNNSNNPVALYEDLKWLCQFSVLLVFNFNNSRALSKGIVEEAKNLDCRVVLQKFAIDPGSKIVQTFSRTVGALDSFGANGFATIETIGDPVYKRYKRPQPV